jgi:hypothetical protein
MEGIMDIDITERMNEIVESKLKDDEYLLDACAMCLHEIKTLINATTLDDKLYALGNLKECLEGVYYTEALRDEVIEQLEYENSYNEADKYEGNRHD